MPRDRVQKAEVGGANSNTFDALYQRRVHEFLQNACEMSQTLCKTRFAPKETASFAVRGCCNSMTFPTFSNNPISIVLPPVGLKIDVLWPDDGTWYRAHVTAIRGGRKEKVKIDYVEGTVEWVEKSKFKFNHHWRYPQELPEAKSTPDSIVVAPASGCPGQPGKLMSCGL